VAARCGELVDALSAVEARSGFTRRLARLTVAARPAVAAHTPVVIDQLDAVASPGADTRRRQALIDVRLTPCSSVPAPSQRTDTVCRKI